MDRLKFIGIIFAALSFKTFAQDKPMPTPQWRPVYHFTPEKNWTNDPNGLLYLNGKFQLYYQHNPFENKWGHMSWGHAESTDLVHWTHLPVAIPEIVTSDTITYIYSGSAVLDKYNTSGFGKKGKPPVVAIFTADQPNQRKESQYIAYSNDNGMHYTLYAKNPVIDLNKHDFRDPNVFWHEATKQWIMTVAMVDEHQVRFYGSKDLKSWTKLSDFGPAGYTKKGWECPSLISLPVDGDSKRAKYVLFVSCFGDRGPKVQYFIGDFDGTSFKNQNSAGMVLQVDYGDAFYAAISWRDAPGNKKIFMGWLINGKPETYPWKGQMAIPRDLSLRTTVEGIRLFQNPSGIISKQLQTLSDGRLSVKTDLPVNAHPIELGSNGNANWIDAEFKIGKSKKVGFGLAEKPDSDQKVLVGYDAVKQRLYIDCSTSERENKPVSNLLQTAPMKAVNGVVKIKVLIDKSSLEVFGNDGEKVISTMIYPDTNATGIAVFSEGKATVKSLKLWNLN